MASTLPAETTQYGELLGFAWELHREYEAKTSPEARKSKGQVFTPPPVCRFMAGLFSVFPKESRLLDPGAGVGSLTAAVAERFLQLRSPRCLEVHLFENDPVLLDLLDSTMRRCQSVLERAGHSFRYCIHEEDFVLASAGDFSRQRSLFPSGLSLEPFHAVITNPPYFKVNKNSIHARMMDDVIHGQPNIYTFFLALAANQLRPGGELVAITPRSFCNGLYFRGFRKWFFERMSLRHIHLFESRTHTFKEANILQESVITHTSRLGDRPNQVTITRTFGRDFSGFLDEQMLPADTILDDTSGDMVVRIPETAQDANILDCIEAWPSRFTDMGLMISTGPVVMFRTTEFLVAHVNERKTVPLLSAHNVKPFATLWPIDKKKWPKAFRDCAESRKYLVPTRNYVLLKRFSAKEERRRLTAGCFLAANARHHRVALENHINYIYHAERELTEEETYGIAALFNSTLLDRYFRSISGNTQVNATEIRTMKFPNLRLVDRIGKRAKALPRFSAGEVDAVVLDELNINGPLRQYLKGLSS
jgi:adenine-specific DNA-methyltransferase